MSRRRKLLLRLVRGLAKKSEREARRAYWLSRTYTNVRVTFNGVPFDGVESITYRQRFDLVPSR